MILLIVKERSYPQRAIAAKKLLSRLPYNYTKHQIIEEFYRREDAGYWGEKALDYYLSFLPEDEYFIFQHIRLKYKKWTFQIDFLLLTTKFALIIESKNYTATLKFESQFNQLIQNKNDQEKSYDDPIAQVKIQQNLLTKWLKKYTTIYLPIHHLVVISNSNAILKTDPNNKEVLKKVCKPFKLLDKIKEIEAVHQKVAISEMDLQEISELILKYDTPEEFNILEYFKISIEEIATGVLCQNCGALPMVFRKGKWFCQTCETSSKTAHIESLEDYFYLIKDSITSHEFRQFLHIPTKDIAQKYLKKLNLPQTGNTKARIYYRKDLKRNALPGTRRQANPTQVQS
jgi:uncharacterized Zn finger protein (UPF0148 family)